MDSKGGDAIHQYPRADSRCRHTSASRRDTVAHIQCRKTEAKCNGAGEGTRPYANRTQCRRDCAVESQPGPNHGTDGRIKFPIWERQISVQSLTIFPVIASIPFATSPLPPTAKNSRLVYLYRIEEECPAKKGKRRGNENIYTKIRSLF